jgi:DNA-directed RNA polymerase subunit RPC12/RpoP
MTSYCPTCGKEIEDDEFTYRCQTCKALIGALTKEKLDAAIKRHVCRERKVKDKTKRNDH